MQVCSMVNLRIAVMVRAMKEWRPSILDFYSVVYMQRYTQMILSI
jgi:hypothetical protein